MSCYYPDCPYLLLFSLFLITKKLKILLVTYAIGFNLSILAIPRDHVNVVIFIGICGLLLLRVPYLSINLRIRDRYQ